MRYAPGSSPPASRAATRCDRVDAADQRASVRGDGARAGRLAPSPSLPFGRIAAHMEHCEDDDQVGLDGEVDSVGEPTKQNPPDSRPETSSFALVPLVCGDDVEVRS